MQALDSNMISMGWAWIGPTDILNAEEAKIPGKDTWQRYPQRVDDAKRALSGWLYFQDDRHFESGFVESVKAQTLADFGIDASQSDASTLHPTSTNLYDVCSWTYVIRM